MRSALRVERAPASLEKARALASPDLHKQRRLGSVKQSSTHALRTDYDYLRCRSELLFHTNREHRHPCAPCDRNKCVSQRPPTHPPTQQRTARLRGSTISCWPPLALRNDISAQSHDLEIPPVLRAGRQRATTPSRRATIALHESASTATTAHVPNNLERLLNPGCDTGVPCFETGDRRLLRHGGAGQAGGPDSSQR